jgi:hypothetical protein
MHQKNKSALPSERRNGKCAEKRYRIVHEVSNVDAEKESRSAYKKYQNLHRISPKKEMYVVYSGWHELAFEERMWMGIRGRI